MATRDNVVQLHPRGHQSSGPLPERSDDELMELCAAGVSHAMAELIRRYQHRVRRYCQKWEPGRGDDLAQEAFLKLWESRQRYRPSGRFAVYLFTIVRNHCRNRTRLWFRRPEPVPMTRLADGPQQAPDQLDSLLAAERERRVGRAISQLAPKLREAVLLRYGEGLSHAEIATIVGAGEATVRSRVFHGLSKLRTQLEEAP